MYFHPEVEVPSDPLRTIAALVSEISNGGIRSRGLGAEEGLA